MRTALFTLNLLVITTSLIVPAVADAAIWRPYWGTSPPLLPCGITIPPFNQAPCTSVCQLLILFQRLINFGITIVAFAIAPIIMILGGARMLIARGSPEQFSTGRKMITGAIVGVLIAFGAFLIVNTFFFSIGIVVGGPLSTWNEISCTP